MKPLQNFQTRAWASYYMCTLAIVALLTILAMPTSDYLLLYFVLFCPVWSALLANCSYNMLFVAVIVHV